MQGIFQNFTSSLKYIRSLYKMYFSKVEGRAKGNQRLIHFIAEREEQKLGKY